MSERFEEAALDRFHQQEAAKGVPEGSQQGGFMPMQEEGDPGKLAYLHNANWQGKTMLTRKLNVDSRVCPGCLFPDAPEGKWPHTMDARCSEPLRQAMLRYCERAKELGLSVEDS